ncbi:MAG: iron-containing redox enzyme family protein [Scytonema sp. PMC 1069.18]|nr:iron-containing redox enzyme family protein [Scytonema sp. PMC 1069.18]MEC4885338.1 iron-containing redox enzyme family protein [Scytonema sp. PMC 1070.18]
MNSTVLQNNLTKRLQELFLGDIHIANIQVYVEELEQLVHQAFKNKNSTAWQDLQEMLFKMNQRLLQSGYGLGTVRSLREWVIRDTIERVEQQYLSQQQVPKEIDNAEVFLTWLKQQIQNHRVNSHPLFSLFDNDTLSDEDIRYFLANHWVYTENFHLHIAAYSLSVPFTMREELFKNIYDEMGRGNFSEAHPNLFLPLLNYFGGLRPEDINPETCYFFNTQVNLCWFADGLHYGIGGMGALELSVPLQHKRVLDHLIRCGLSPELVKFFVIHCAIDGEHADGWFAAGMPYVRTFEDLQKVFAGAMRILEARVTLYDGILKGIRLRKD